MVSFLGRNNWGISDQREVDTWVRHQVGLELGQVNIKCTIESKGRGDGRNDLTNQSIQVGVSWSLDVEVSAANIVDGFIINHKGTVGVFEGCMGGQNGVVWLNNGCGNL